MERLTACHFRWRAAIRRAVPFVALLLSLTAAMGWSQELNEAELATAAGRSYAFKDFAGPVSVIETADQILGVGRILARTLSVDGRRGDYFGKYGVIRAFNPAETSLLGADIILFGAAARVDHIKNVQRIVAGYLTAAFGYNATQADRLAALVTSYNAAYRGNIAALSRKFSQSVMSNLTAENAGIALSYAEWPGRTRLVIPLGRAVSASAPGPAVASGSGSGASGSQGAQAGGPRQAFSEGGALPQSHLPAASAGSARSSPSAPPTTGTPAPPTRSSATDESASGPLAPSAPEAAESATLELPHGVIRGGKQLPVRFMIHSGSRQELVLQLQSVRRDDGVELLQRPVTVRIPPQGSGVIRATIELPDATPLGRQSVPVEVGFSGRLPVRPANGVLEIDYIGQTGLLGGAFSGMRPAWILLIAAFLLAALALLAVLVVGIARASLQPGWARGMYLSAREGYPLVEMIVTTQNRHIGLRNVHYLRPGVSAAVGGGRSAFLVYFVPVPPRMAYLSYDGRKYTFSPAKAELFPDLAGPVEDCLGKEIRARSPRGYRFTIVFRRFISPLEEINRLMRSAHARPPEEFRPPGSGPGTAPPRPRTR